MNFENIEITNENAIEIAEKMKIKLCEIFMKSYDEFISNGREGLDDFVKDIKKDNEKYLHSEYVQSLISYLTIINRSNLNNQIKVESMYKILTNKWVVNTHGNLLYSYFTIFKIHSHLSKYLRKNLGLDEKLRDEINLLASENKFYCQ